MCVLACVCARACVNSLRLVIVALLNASHKSRIGLKIRSPRGHVINLFSDLYVIINVIFINHCYYARTVIIHIY